MTHYVIDSLGQMFDFANATKLTSRQILARQSFYDNPANHSSLAVAVMEEFLRHWRGDTMWVQRHVHGAIPRRQRLRWCDHVLKHGPIIRDVFLLMGQEDRAEFATGMLHYAQHQRRALHKGPPA